MHNRLFAVIILGVFLFWAEMSQAQIFMGKTRIEKEVVPGQIVVDEITIYNTSEIPIEVKVYWQDFMYIEPFDGKKEFTPPGSSPYSMGSWISFSPQKFTLPPKGEKSINFSVQVPADAKGGYYGVLFYEKQDPQAVDGTGVSVITRLGTLFFIESNHRSKASKIDQIKILQQTLSGVFHNLGDVILIPKGVYYVMDSQGLVVDRGKLDSIYLPPGKEKSFSLNLPTGLLAGTYTLVLTFDLKSGDSLVKEVDIESSSSGELTIKEIRD